MSYSNTPTCRLCGSIRKVIETSDDSILRMCPHCDATCRKRAACKHCRVDETNSFTSGAFE